MIRRTLHALGLLALTASLTFASIIPPSLTTFDVYSQLGQIFNTGPTIINNGMKTGSGIGPAPSGITYNGGGGYQTTGATESTAFSGLVAAVSGLGGTLITSWSAPITPGNYTFTTVPDAAVVLTVPGDYVFSYTGGLTSLTFLNVDITMGANLSSDDVVWYIPADTTVNNSTFGGVLVVDGFGATVEGNGGSTDFTGRVLAAGTNQLFSLNAGAATFSTQYTILPEPSPIFLLFPALVFGAFVRYRRTREKAIPSEC